MNGTHEMDNDSIKVNIVRKRTEEGISQDEMARRLRISRNTYRSIEKGTAKVISERLNEIASSLNTSAEELVLGYKPVERNSEVEDIRMEFDDKNVVFHLKNRYEKEKASLIADYENRINVLTDHIASLESTISNMREIIDSKNEIISLMKREESKK